MWSQYLEVAIGPDAEIFTKSPVLSTVGWGAEIGVRSDSTRSEERTSELQSLMRISYAVFCLKKKTPHYNIQQLSICKLLHKLFIVYHLITKALWYTHHL